MNTHTLSHTVRLNYCGHVCAAAVETEVGQTTCVLELVGSGPWRGAGALWRSPVRNAWIPSWQGHSRTDPTMPLRIDPTRTKLLLWGRDEKGPGDWPTGDFSPHYLEERWPFWLCIPAAALIFQKFLPPAHTTEVNGTNADSFYKLQLNNKAGDILYLSPNPRAWPKLTRNLFC